MRMAKLPLPHGFPPAPTRTRMPAAGKIPKKPGNIPPFALFVQDHRPIILEENRDISFSEAGKKLGEMWHALSEEEREEYRQRAKDQAEVKLREWHEKMKEFPNQALNPLAQVTSQKRRRTHGYAIFSSEMRKKITSGIPLAETTKIIAEKWRTASQHIRQAYEARAAAINESENRKFQNLLVQTQRRQQQLQMQQQQQRKQQLMLQHQQQRQAIRERLYPGLAGRPQGSGSGLRITSVASLKRNSPGLTGGVNLPSSITVSRVEPEISIVEDPSPISHRSRAPPPLLRGGMGRRMGNPLQRSPHGQLLQQALQMQKHQLQQQQAQMMHRPMRGLITSAGFSAMKRPMAGSPGGLPSKHPRLMPRPGASDSDLGARASTGGARCRICAQMSPFTQLIKEDPDIVETLKLLLGLNLEDDEDPSYPDAICKRCIGQLANFLQFKKAYEAGQLKLKEIAVSKKRPSSPSNIAKTSTKIVSEAELQPDLDCEVDEGESVHPVPASKSGSSPSEKNQKDGDDDDKEDSDDERPDPMMFLQLSQVESSYSGFDEDEEGENNGEEAKEEEEEDTDWNIDAELENEGSVGNGHEDDEDLEGGVEEIGDDDEGVEEVGDDDPDQEDVEDLGEGVDAELENLEESLELESGDDTGDYLDDATNPELDNDAENLEDEEDA